ncbi:C4-dicarboxylate ABC transporter [Lysinibacillus sp. 2017]|uniref:TRAP transporter large permease n=1 Tax=unclassified Lysinibacillus TaxID=2636778 RepID=UPI000D525770|nr:MULTISPECIES: TRAP transporter large permease [unclassified Lysinibacillus]AWE07248.1 C4-dicarboxylate ABC transporter [Lysinibacillus sp. 2017]TGN33305.1 TRAP transporter large permease [Lysinibacillus sp. S2017]
MLIVAIVFLTLLFLNMPVAFAIGIGSLMYFFIGSNLPIEITTQRMVAGTQSFPLLAVPFFILAGNLMNASGITERLIRFSNALTGHLQGSLAHVSIVLSTVMGGVSGSANADAAMQSRILGQKMIDRGYSGGYSASVIAISSLITATIPPSIGLILYGYVGQVSIGKLFLAGIIPGLLMMVILMVISYIIARKRGYDSNNEQRRATLPEIGETLKESIWALMFPVILVVGIRFGIFTASEAGAFAVVYAIVIGFFVYKELNWKNFKEALSQSITDNASILLIISVSSILGFLITYDRLPQNAADFLIGVTTNGSLMVILILIFLVIAGMFIESTVLVLLLTPIFLPVVQQVGIDPVHFGILMMTIVTFGGMTPPVGVTMYTTTSIMKVPLEDYIKESIPFILGVFLLVLILTFFPSLVMFLPDLFM